MKYLLVGGPNAANIEVMLGNYFGLSTSVTTVLEGLAARTPEYMRLDYRKGCLLNAFPPNKKDWLLAESSKADAVVLAMGIDPSMEGEEGDAIASPVFGDRANIELPENQVDFLRRLRKGLDARNASARLIVLLFGGSIYAAPEVHELADAILQVGYPGEAGGTAIAEILFGDHCPEGRLTLTAPQSTADLPAYEDYAMQGRTYRYMDPARMLYPMGFGLSYTQFKYAFADESSQPHQLTDGSVELKFLLQNTGEYSGAEIVQCYLRFPEFSTNAPRLQLIDFKRVELAAGARELVTLKIPPQRFQRINDKGERISVEGEFQLFVGGACPVPISSALGAAKSLHFLWNPSSALQ